MTEHRHKGVRRRTALLLCVLAAQAAAGSTHAGQVAGWWGGSWSCTIDGRPARMKWHAADDSRVDCDGGTCAGTSGARWVGRFSDNGAAWVPLTEPRKGNQGGFFFRHADGNQWYLAAPGNGTATGWTTWNGRRYPLSCRR